MLAYEELKGSSGKEIWFRPPRYEARTLFPQLPPRVRVRSGLLQIRDISLGGVAAVCHQTNEDLPDVGDVVPLTIQQSGLPIFESDARVCRREDNVFGSLLAFSFVNSFIEFEKLLSRNAQAHLAAHMQANSADAGLVSKEYRQFCADVLGVLRTYRAVLTENAALAQKVDCAYDVDSYYNACESRLIQQWRPLWRAGNELVRAIGGDREILRATKEFTELVLTPEFRNGAIWDRSYAKPLGYPGDFEVMKQVYAWQRTGSDVYGMLLHRLGLEVAECIMTRMNHIGAQITKLVQSKTNERAVRILSLGCGPAREVELYLAQARGLGSRVEFTLVDQERAALLEAYERTYPHIMRSNGQASVRCMNVSFTEILRGLGDIAHLAPQDLIYSVGLIDYLGDRRARALTRRLYEQLAPGGLLIIGNMNEIPLSNLWPMECIADWSLHYRGEVEMLGWARGLQPAMAWTETESTGRVRFLFVHKP